MQISSPYKLLNCIHNANMSLAEVLQGQSEKQTNSFKCKCRFLQASVQVASLGLSSFYMQAGWSSVLGEKGSWRKTGTKDLTDS